MELWVELKKKKNIKNCIKRYGGDVIENEVIIWEEEKKEMVKRGKEKKEVEKRNIKGNHKKKVWEKQIQKIK